MANASNVFALLVISPFVALVVAGVPQLELEPLLAPPTRPVEWGVFLSVLLWNTSGYDSVGALAAEVAEPGRDFPRAMPSRSSSSLSSTSCRSASAPLSMPSG